MSFCRAWLTRVDGVTLNDWDNEKDIEKLAELSGLQRVGVIYTDLLQQTDREKGIAVCKRHADSYYLSSLEVCCSPLRCGKSID